MKRLSVVLLIALLLLAVQSSADGPVGPCSPLQYRDDGTVYYKHDGAQYPTCGMPEAAECSFIEHWSGAQWWMCRWNESDPMPTFDSPLPLKSPLTVVKASEAVEVRETTIAPTSGKVNGVWVPVYGLPCDQVYENGSPSCMCFYNAPQWCR